MGKIIVLHDVSFTSNNLGRVTLVGNEGENQELNYSEMYFTIESLEDNNTIRWVRSSGPTNISLSYSINNGINWTNLTLSSSTDLFTLNTGDKAMLKGINENFATAWNAYNAIWSKDNSKNFKIYGNVMSLLFGDNFTSNSEFTIGTTYNLCGLFYGATTLIDASNLILPASECTEGCYNEMFRDCTNLSYGPKVLPATQSATGCYSSMFEGCINLENSGLPEINLVNTSSICCKRMFCMDRNNKITTPKMTKSPILRSWGATMSCYEEMFKGNGNLVEVTCLLYNVLGTANWLTNCSDTGIFKRRPNSNWGTGTTSGIPSGWTIVDYVEE